MSGIDADALARQEEGFGRAFAAGDIHRAAPLYHPEVIYLSPTVRLFDWPARIEGREKTLEFIALTIRQCRNTVYTAVEQAVLDGGRSAFVRIHFDYDRQFDGGEHRLRSNYVVLYRYRDGLIGQQELYYDPSGRLEVLSRRALNPR